MATSSKSKASKPAKSKLTSSSSMKKALSSSASSGVQTSAKKKRVSKFKDLSTRESLDAQTQDLQALTTASNPASSSNDKQDPFSYGGQATAADRKRTRRQVESTADALDALCGLMGS
ncbi:hypothetical protein BCV70DRAFT_197304 [Testicularia cyperi]|uniref:Uncharacterized protein n=1 Tax=Testicularia cyperi TaxID=1882483 RepID=A0A317XXQ7_9BASI|nr:hypothetical protein BCV70DRAFT_197304 [Testicularia cyperi]